MSQTFRDDPLDPDAVKALTQSAAKQDSVLSREVARRLAERIGKNLEARPLALAAASHRSRLAEILKNLPGQNHYQLLGVALGSSIEEVHDAYERLARLVHPRHAQELGLQGGRTVLELLFEHATEAYLTLHDPSRRREYDEEMGLDAMAPKDPAERLREKKNLARDYFNRARRLVEAEEYHLALSALKEAVRNDPQVEYYQLLGEVQGRNPNWLHHAADSYRQALSRAPNRPEIRMALAKVYEDLRRTPEAESEYLKVLELWPGDREAEEGLQRLRERERQKKRDQGWRGVVRRWLDKT